jgi:hypothetical protein
LFSGGSSSNGSSSFTGGGVSSSPGSSERSPSSLHNCPEGVFSSHSGGSGSSSQTIAGQFSPIGHPHESTGGITGAGGGHFAFLCITYPSGHVFMSPFL